MRINTVAALCIAATTAVVFTGCADNGNAKSTGGAAGSTPSRAEEPFPGLSGGEILDQAFEATMGARSVRVKGDIQDDTSGGPLRIDIALDTKGDCVGTLSADGGKTDVIRVGDAVYMRYDEAFLRAQMEGEPQEDSDAAVDMLAGKWTTAGKDAEAAEIADLCDLDTLLGDDTEGASAATRGRTTTVDGTPALALKEKDGKDTYTAYVATQGKPYVLRLDSDAAGDSGSLVLSDYDKPVAAKKPAGEILDLDDLG
ncbi:hypothetical protein RKD23_004479 [Streptomyces sp. SAI-170]|uniref:hypothetical protein n=1 Tax=Streptomyces sp. SAI-170 TaxID=3377729 RepID=UPI003C7E090A